MFKRIVNFIKNKKYDVFINQFFNAWISLCFLFVVCSSIFMRLDFSLSIYNSIILIALFYAPLIYFFIVKKISKFMFLKINILSFVFLLAFLKIGENLLFWKNFNLSGCIYMSLYICVAMSFLFIGIKAYKTKRYYKKKQKKSLYILLLGLVVLEQIFYSIFIADNLFIISSNIFRNYLFISINLSFGLFLFWFYKVKYTNKKMNHLKRTMNIILFFSFIQCLIMNAILFEVFSFFSLYQFVLIALLSYLLYFSLELNAKKVLSFDHNNIVEKNVSFNNLLTTSEIEEIFANDLWYVV